MAPAIQSITRSLPQPRTGRSQPVVHGIRSGAESRTRSVADAGWTSSRLFRWGSVGRWQAQGGGGLSVGGQGRGCHRVLGGRRGWWQDGGIRTLDASVVSIEVVGIYRVGEMVGGGESIVGGEGLQVCRDIRQGLKLGRGRKEGTVDGVALVRLQWRMMRMLEVEVVVQVQMHRAATAAGLCLGGRRLGQIILLASSADVHVGLDMGSRSGGGSDRRWSESKVLRVGRQSIGW